MDDFTKQLNELIEVKNIVDAYKCYIDGKGKVPVEEIYLNKNIEETIKKIIDEEKGFLIRNNEKLTDKSFSEIDVGDLFQLIETFEKVGFFTEYIFSKDMNEMFIKVVKVDSGNT